MRLGSHGRYPRLMGPPQRTPPMGSRRRGAPAGIVGAQRYPTKGAAAVKGFRAPFTEPLQTSATVNTRKEVKELLKRAERAGSRRKPLLAQCPGRVPLGIPGAIQENYRVMMPPKDPQKAEKKEAGCVHPYVLQWSGKCEGCRTMPLSPSLPDPFNPRTRPQSRRDAA
jgi:hypothetical protein